MSTAEMINHELAARWETCCEAVGIDTDATAAEWREAYEAKRAQVQREAAAVKALREAEQDSQMGPVPYGWSASGIASWLKDRAKQIMGGADHA